MNHLTIILFLLLTGCQTIVSGVNDCSNINGRACRKLRRRGWKTDIAVLLMPNHPGKTHAVVAYPNGSYRDFTRKGAGTNNLSEWGTLLYIVPGDKLDLYGKEFK